MGSCHGGMSRSTFNGRCLMLGLDSSGKTTILYMLRLNELISTIPTIGFNVETVNVAKHGVFHIWDVGGQSRIRSLWHHYFQNCQGLLYVVDSADVERLPEARDELHRVLESDEMVNVPLVVLANKQDMPGAASVSEITDQLGLKALSHRQWHIQATSAKSGDGLLEGMEAMSVLAKKKKSSGV